MAYLCISKLRYCCGLSYSSDAIMGAMTSQITSLTIVYSTVYSDVDQRKHHSSASMAFVRGIHRWPVNSTHKGPVTGKMFPFDDVIIVCSSPTNYLNPGWAITFHQKIFTIQTFLLREVHIKISFTKCRHFCCGISMLKHLTEFAAKICVSRQHSQCISFLLTFKLINTYLVFSWGFIKVESTRMVHVCTLS